MRLVRLGAAGSETPGVLVDDDTFVDLEVELGIVIGRRWSYLADESEAAVPDPTAVR